MQCSHQRAAEPDNNPGSLIARGRRTFPVYEPNKCQVLFLKDGWRANLPGMTNEIEILQELERAGVCHISHFMLGGDLGGEHTTVSVLGRSW